MDPRFLGFYERELKHVREMGGEFARAFPKIAGRLGLDAFGCKDPYVERLIEAFAFLTARVQLKLAAEQGEFTQHMLELLYPGYLAPTPSMAVVQMEPSSRQGSLAEGVTVPRGASLRTPLGEQQTSCEYRTAHPVTLWPIELESADYSTHLSEILDVERVAVPEAKAALRLVLRTTLGHTFDKLPLDALPLFLRGGDEIAVRLYEQLLGSAIGMVVQSASRPHSFMTTSRGACVGELGFEEHQALLPCGLRGFDGYRLLHEFFVFPERFIFADVRGMRPLLAESRGDRLELILLFDRKDPRLDGVVQAAHFALFCTPAVNLFPRSGDRMQLSDGDFEHHVVPDRSRPLDYEVHSITQLRGHGTAEGDVEFLPMYAPELGMGPEQPRYAIRRQPRAMTHSMLDGDGSLQTPYIPSETFVSLVDGKHGAGRAGLSQLSVSALCTNRALPLTLRVGQPDTDFREQSGAPIESIRCVAGPTAPRSSPVYGDLAWGLLSHLSLDYLSLMQRDGSAAAPLRELLSLYARFSERSGPRQVEGVLDVRTKGVVRPLPFAGPLTFGRGIELTVTCDERAYSGTGAFLLGAVLSRFFAKYASINSFTETVLCTQQRGEVMRWAVTAGRRSTV